MAFGPVDPQLDLAALETRVLARWQQAGLPAQVRKLRQGAEPWVFYEGPPTANGRPGLHHVWARVFKDLYPRFQTMRGRDVPRKGGWDCHGLPVEIEVEKELGFTSKDQIEEFGISEFNDRCRASVQRYVADWQALTERAGVWIDTEDAYWTLSNDYIESVWWLMRQMFDDGLLYEGHRVVPYCRRCGTALSSHELGQPGAYREVTDTSVFVRFPLVDDDADLLVWTTTPWTLISNVAAAVGPEIDYVRVHDGSGGRDLIMAAARAERTEQTAEVVARYSGQDLVGRRYRRPFELLDIDERGQRVVAAGFVTTEDGSGIVHLAPAFGADDMEVARAEDLPVLNPVGPKGTFDQRVGPWRDRVVKEVDPEIVADLDRRDLLVAAEPYTHSYPHCWRCGTPLIYWAKTSWFVRTSQRRTEMLAENEKIDWHPEHIKHGRFGDWLENNVDWALSRDRYWGTPLPIWRCEEGHDTCIGSLAELSELAGQDLSELDLHRPYVDEVAFSCPVGGCAAVARRVAPVLDAWFDSGAMPSAQHHFPFEAGPGGTSAAGGQAKPSLFPADFICEAIDQTRGWFYSLLAVNTLVFGETPFRSVVCLGLLVDENGQKMSKSKGNVVDPLDVFARFGADALRWYFLSAGSPWSSRRVYEEGLRESTRQTLLTLWNVFSFFATYADIDCWEPADAGDGADGGGAQAHVLDRWVAARLDQTIATVTERLEAFDALGASAVLATFVDDLSNWYVRRSRSRFWGDNAPHAVLHRALVATAQMLAPFCPFLADEIYSTLTGEPSVHLSDWPTGRQQPSRGAGERGVAVDAGGREMAAGAGDDLGSQMDAARRLVGLGRSARTEARVATRQPLRRALLLHPGATLSEEVRSEIAQELNVKGLDEIGSLAEVMTWTVVPNFRLLGPRLGARVNEVKQALATADGAELRRQLDSDGWVTVAGERLDAGELEVRAGHHEGFALTQDGSWAVALDLELDDDLRCEGVARQLAREINDLRKRQGLALSDRVAITIEAGPKVAAAVDTHRRWLAAQVLAQSITLGATGGRAQPVEIDGERATVEVSVSPS